MAAEIMAPMGHPDYKSEIAEIIRSSLAPKLKKERILSRYRRRPLPADQGGAQQILQHSGHRQLIRDSGIRRRAV